MADRSNVTTRQPGVGANANNPFFQPTVEWSHGLFDCCTDSKECLYAYFCSCCFLNDLAKSINDESGCGCCIPNRLGVYRMRVRSLLKIKGTAMNDCCVVTHCGVCAAVQMKLELKAHGLA